ncbi:ATP synthase subunit I [Aeromonas salmonicida]
MSTCRFLQFCNVQGAFGGAEISLERFDTGLGYTCLPTYPDPGWAHLRGIPAGYASLYGGGVYLIPQLLFSLFTLSRKLGPGSAGWVLWDFCVGAGIKLVSTVALFVTVLLYVEVEHLPLYVTYALSLFFQWVITIVLNNRY